jgi:hypothetical protein
MPKAHYKLSLDGQITLDQGRLKSILIEQMPELVAYARAADMRLKALIRKHATKTATSQITAMRKNTASK